MDYDSSKNKNLWARIYCGVFHVIYLHWHKGEVKLLHQLTNVEGVLEPECHKGVLKPVRGSWMRDSWSPGTPIIEVLLTEAKQERQGEACRSLPKCDDVWASVSGPASIPASWSNGQGFCGIPDKKPHNPTLLGKTSDRQKLRGTIFVYKNTDLHASQMLRSGRHHRAEELLWVKEARRSGQCSAKSGHVLHQRKVTTKAVIGTVCEIGIFPVDQIIIH